MKSWIFAALAALMATPCMAQPITAPTLDELRAEGRRDKANDPIAAHKITCPIGGEVFEQANFNIGYPLEGFPDGSGPGSEGNDRTIVECPGNGLVVMPAYEHPDGDSQETYSAAELARLPALIASPEYQALRKDSRMARLYWLSVKLGRAPMQQWHLLQYAMWVAVEPGARRTAVERFLAEGDALAARPDYPKQFRRDAEYFAINALRELGRFDEARARLITLADGDAEYRAMAAKVSGADHYDVRNDDAPTMTSALMAAIDDKDDDRQPVNMMGQKWARLTCGKRDDGYPVLGKNAARTCARRKTDEAFQEQLYALESKLEDKVARDKLCRVKPAAALTKLEAAACENARMIAVFDQQRSKALTEARALLRNPANLDAQCAQIVVLHNTAAKTGLGEACQQRAKILYERKQKQTSAQLAKDPAAYARLCPWKYPQFSAEDPVESACADAQTSRDVDESDQQRIWVDSLTPAQLATECVKIARQKDDADKNYTLEFRCNDIAGKRHDALWDALSADPARLEAACALPFEETPNWMDSRCYSRAQDKIDAEAWQLAKDHAALIATCAATPVAARDRAMRAACDDYRKCVIARYDANVPAGFLKQIHISEEGRRKGRYGDGQELYCYETAAEADAAWVQVQDPKAQAAPRKLEPFPDRM